MEDLNDEQSSTGDLVDRSKAKGLHGDDLNLESGKEVDMSKTQTIMDANTMIEPNYILAAGPLSVELILDSNVPINYNEEGTLDIDDRTIVTDLSIKDNVSTNGLNQSSIVVNDNGESAEIEVPEGIGFVVYLDYN